MTTIAYRDGIMVSDGKVTSGDRIECLNLKKIRKINNCLVGGAGSLTSVLAFFDWFQEWSDAQVVQGQSPQVSVVIPECINDEDFSGIVVFSDSTIYHYQGGKKSFEIPGEKYTSIGSGSDYALAALDAGQTAEEAVKIAANRDVFTGGEIFTEQLDIEPEDITLEEAQAMTKEELLALMFPELQEGEEEEEHYEDQNVVYQGTNLFLTSDGVVSFVKKDFNSDVYVIKGQIALEDTSPDSEEFSRILSKVSTETFIDCYTELSGKSTFTLPTSGDLNLQHIADQVFDMLDRKYQEFLMQQE